MAALDAPATLRVDNWSSRCSVCGLEADPSEPAHLTRLGYGKHNGDPGCGARWTHITSTVVRTGIDARLAEMRPDLIVIPVSDGIPR